MNTYEAKKQRRIERYQELAEKSASRSESLYKEARRMASVIPMGQPILVGHHSEKSDRRYRDRIHNKFDQSFKEQEKASYYEERARSAERRSAIDSDDPEAIQKLKGKIKRIMEANAETKRLNALMRKQKTYPQCLEWSKGFKDTDKDCQTIYDHLKNHWVRSWACPSDEINRYYFSTRGDSAEIKRLERRIKALETSKSFKDFEVNGIKVELVDGQIQVDFGFKPSENIRKKLKSYPLSLKWSRYSERWVRKYTASTGQYFIKELIEVLEGVINESLQ